MDSTTPILRPLPRRPNNHSQSHNPQQSSTSTENALEPPSDVPEETSSATPSAAPSRNRSILNLTSSTLFGIYQPTSFDTRDTSEPATPWGTGAETPARSPSFSSWREGPQSGQAQRGAPVSLAEARPSVRVAAKRKSTSTIERIGRGLALFAFGVAYGSIVSHLHDTRHIAPVRVEGIDRASWGYLAFWGVAGVLLGTLLPWVDRLLGGVDQGVEEQEPEDGDLRSEKSRERTREGSGGMRDMALGAEWHPIVRSIGAFVGIAFAIRKLPWQSTLQVSLTLMLANPALWYLLDRTVPGFVLSLLVGLFGTGALLAINPHLVPSPASLSSNGTYTTPSPGLGGYGAAETVGGVVSYDTVGVATWIGSVLFCSCVCFGNIGRILKGR
ncbi:hypothetical protein K402DRAFT_340609 [Aulographum hederae CBS 113979]|uniref:INSIG-domain-containing protein n=1 Tax=Aulographum hederae CBS 113979 TaxID=1176131 RepID=A0A6G1GND5_9PEZI|nr:hypothetical protein K402DRAFT_340609 [Aulographum hederae CBS 113979]